MSPLLCLIFLVPIVLSVDRSCLRRILDQFCNDVDDLRPILYVSEAGTDSNMFVNVGNHSYVIDKRQLYQPLSCNNAKCVVYLGASLDLLDELLWSVKRFLRPIQLVLLYVAGVEVEQVFRMVWMEYFSDVVLVVQDGVFTYFPITGGECSRVVPVYLGRCEEVVIGTLRESQVGYYPNCPVYISAQKLEPFIFCDSFEQNAGLEVSVLRVIVHKLGLRPVFNVGYCTEQWQSGNRSTMEVYIASFSLTWGPQPIYYIAEDTAMYLLKSEAEEPWKNTFRIFDATIWTCLFASILCVTATCYLVHNDGLIQTSVFFVVAVLISSVPSVPGKLNQIFLFWLVGSFLIYQSYIGLLTSFLLKSIHKHQIATLDEMTEAGYEFAGLHQQHVFRNFQQSNKSTEYYYDHYKNCEYNEISECFQLLTQGGLVFVSSRHLVGYHSKINRVGTLYKGPILLTDYLGISTTQNWYSRRIEETLLQLNEGGIVQHLDQWTDTVHYVDEPDFKVLTLNHLYFIFSICSVGLAAASVAFLLELFRPPLHVSA